MELIVTTREDLQQLIRDSLSTLLQELQLVGAAQPTEIVDVKTICSRLDITPQTWSKMRKRYKVPTIGDNRFNWPEVVESLKTKKRGR